MLPLRYRPLGGKITGVLLGDSNKAGLKSIILLVVVGLTEEVGFHLAYAWVAVARVRV